MRWWWFEELCSISKMILPQQCTAGRPEAYNENVRQHVTYWNCATQTGVAIATFKIEHSKTLCFLRLFVAMKSQKVDECKEYVPQYQRG
jgi:hypothetical protein